MGCTCSKGRNSLDESLNEIIEDAKISQMTTEEYINLIKKALKSKKDLNDKLNFQTEIMEVSLRPISLFIQITYLKNTLLNLPDSMSNCLLIFALLFLCKFKNLENLKKNYSELFNLIKNQIKGLENFSSKNNISLVKKIIEFYATLISKHLLDVYVFSLAEAKNQQKEIYNEYNYMFSPICIKLYTNNLFERYNPQKFDTDNFLDENFNLFDHNILREHLRETYIKKENEIKNQNPNIVLSSSTEYIKSSFSKTQNSYGNFPNDLLVSAGNSNGNRNLDNRNEMIKTVDNATPYNVSFINKNESKEIPINYKRNLGKSQNLDAERSSLIVDRSLKVRVDNYLKESGLITDSFSNSNLVRNTANPVNNRIINTDPISVSQCSKNQNILENKLLIESDLSEFDSGKSKNNVLYNNIDSNIKNKKDELIKEPLNTLQKEPEISKDIQQQKFNLKDETYKMNTPLIDNTIDNNIENDIKMLVKNRNNSIINEKLYNNSPSNYNDKSTSNTKNDMNDIFGFFNENNANNSIKQTNSNLTNIKDQNNDVFGFFSDNNNNKEEKVNNQINQNKSIFEPTEINNNNNINPNKSLFEPTDINNNTIKPAINGNLFDFGFTSNPDHNIISEKNPDSLKFQSNTQSEKNEMIVPENDPFNIKPEEIEEKEYTKKKSDQLINDLPSSRSNNQREINPTENGNHDNGVAYIDEINSNDILEEKINHSCEDEEGFSLENFREEALRAHNFKRLLHSVEALNPSEELQNKAQEWAEILSEKETLEPQNLCIDDEEIGENLAIVNDLASGEKITEEWYGQIENYNYDNPRKKLITKNFTQMIWKDTSFVGFGCKKGENGIYYVVGYYFPKGNIDREFVNNVLPIDEDIVNQLNEMENDEAN